MFLKLLGIIIFSSSLHAAGGDGPGQFFGVVHNNFDTQVVEARDIENNLYSISRNLFSEKDRIYHGKIVQLMVGPDQIKFIRKLSPEKDIIGKTGKSCDRPNKK